MNIAEWNVRHDLLGFETEIKQMLFDKNISVMFFTETDSESIRGNFNIKDYDTFYPANDNVRVVGIARKEPGVQFKMRDDLMSSRFASIWIECITTTSKKFLICGCYREWTVDGDDSINGQKERLNIFIDQINRACEENEKVLILGDMNLCLKKWNEKEFRYKSLSEPLRSNLTINNLNIADLGYTYFSDHADFNGDFASSELDHVYFSNTCSVTSKTLPKAGTDHLPILARLELSQKRTMYISHVTKRSFKRFNIEHFKVDLANCKWVSLIECTDVSDAANLYD